MWVLLSRDKYPRPYPPSDNTLWVRLEAPRTGVSVRFHRGGWEVRWRDSDGRERSRRLPSEAAARVFDEAIAEVAPGARRADTARHGRNGGVYSYATASGTRWRFVYRRTNADDKARLLQRAGPRGTHVGDRSSRLSAVRSATPRRRSGATGSGGWLVVVPTSSRAPGPGMRSMGACDWSPRSGTGRSASCRSTIFAVCRGPSLDSHVGRVR